MSMFGGIPIPEEMRKHLEEQAAQQEMAMDSYRHDVLRLFLEVSQEHLATLRHVFHNLTCSGSPSEMAAYYEGLMGGVMMQRFNICPSCGVDHDKQIEDLNKDEKPPEGETVPMVVRPDGTAQTLQEFVDGKPGAVQLTDEQLAIMAEFNIDDAYEEGTGRFLGFVCKNCGMMYPSIADRTKKPADHCDGCIQKAKWG